MKVTLVATHQISMGLRVPLQKCLGVLTLAASLKERGLECEVLDLSHYRLTPQDEADEVLGCIVQEILDSKPDLIGFSTMSSNVVLAIELCRMLKEKDGGVLTILGGPGASFSSGEYIAEFPSIDFILRGEADRTFPELVELIGNGACEFSIAGLVYRNGEEIVDLGWPEPIKDLDTLPIPLYELCTLENEPEREAIQLEVGRGCPFNCVFCSTSTFFRRKFRVKSVERVISEIRLIQEKIGSTYLVFNHDLLTFDHDYIKKLCGELKTLDTPAKWGCSARLDTLSSELIQEMSDAGCYQVFLGIEVATDRMQNLINKKLDLSKLQSMVLELVEHNYGVTLSFIIGFPFERTEDIESILSSAIEAKSIDVDNVSIQIHTLSPELGSDKFEEWKDLLRYDKYGHTGYSELPPLSWTTLRELIQLHPTLFPTYFHYQHESIPRTDYIRYALIGQAIEQSSLFSLQQAFQDLGDGLVATLTQHLHRITIPAPDSDLSRCLELNDSLYSIVTPLMEADTPAFHRYESIAKSEMAIIEVVQTKDDIPIKTIEVSYDPLILMENLRRCSDKQEILEEKRQTLAVFWNDDEEKVAYAPIQDELLDFLTD